MVKGREERLQMPAVSQDSVHQLSTGGYYLAGDLNEAYEEALEFHPQDITAHCRRHAHHAIPGLQIPSQCSNDHIGPVRNQTVRRHPKSVHSILELSDDVLLVAGIIGKQDNLLWSHSPVIGYVEEIPDLVEQPVLALFDRKIFRTTTMR